MAVFDTMVRISHHGKMTHPQNEPVEIVISAFQGVRATARALGINDPSTISKWRKNRSIPSSRYQQILSKARELGLNLSAEDLIIGRKAS